MKFKYKITNEIVEAKSITELYAFSHNSNYEKVEEMTVPKDKGKRNRGETSE